MNCSLMPGGKPFSKPVPPLAEQKRIVAEVERRQAAIAATEQTITANLGRAQRLPNPSSTAPLLGS
jgi:hypothetical protein